MKKFILLMLISCNAHAAAAGAVMLMTTQHKQSQPTGVIDGEKPMVICRYRIENDTCLVGSREYKIGEYVRNRGFSMFKRREYLNQGSLWFLILDVYK